jgi:hypothetical protein
LQSPIRQLSGGIGFKNSPQVVASEPEVVVKAKETPTQRHRIDQETKQLKARKIGRLVTCWLRQKPVWRLSLCSYTGAMRRKSCHRAPKIWDFPPKVSERCVPKMPVNTLS